MKMIPFALLAVPLAAQTRAYATFGTAGETIGLFNLLKQPATCSDWRAAALFPIRKEKRPKKQ